jgi:hypothetical protein
MATTEEKFACLDKQIAALAVRDDDLKAQIPCGVEESVTLAYLGNPGNSGAQQASVEALLDDWGEPNTIFGGNNNYPAGEAATLVAAWNTFLSGYVTPEKAWGVLGAVDLDNTIGDYAGQPQVTFLAYQPGNGRYYKKSFGNGLVDLFVLNTGLNSAGTLVEQDGNTVGSVQQLWLENAWGDSLARYKVIAMYSPIITNEDGATGDRFNADMVWPEMLEADLVLTCGAQVNELIYRRGVPHLSVNSVSATPLTHSVAPASPPVTWQLTGDIQEPSWLVWRDDQIGTAENVGTNEGLASDAGNVAAIHFDAEGIDIEVWQVSAAVPGYIKAKFSI